jgi:hypothetical protein
MQEIQLLSKSLQQESGSLGEFMQQLATVSNIVDASALAGRSPRTCASVMRLMEDFDIGLPPLRTSFPSVARDDAHAVAVAPTSIRLSNAELVSAPAQVAPTQSVQLQTLGLSTGGFQTRARALN